MSIDVPRGLLLRDGQPVKLRPKTWSVLLYLAERPGLLVTKEQLLDALWPGVAVTPDTVSKSISELRAALHDDDKPARYIETANRRGYRFLVDLLSARPRAAAAHAGGAVSEHALDRRPPLHPLVGRERELAVLAAALRRAHAGQPQVLMVSGPAGIGKTALVTGFLESEAVRDSAEPLVVVRAACFEQHGPAEPLLPVLQALESLARQSPERDPLVRLMRSSAPMWLAQMPWLTGREDAEALQRSLQGLGAQRMPREFAALVDGLAADRTLVLVLEDLHASDPATIDVITLLAQRPPPLRLLVVGNYRPADLAVRDDRLASAVRTMLARPQCVQIPLHDLSVDAARAYLAARFPGHAFPEELPGYLHAHTGGQPLFLVSVLEHMVAHGWIVTTGSGWRLGRALSSIDLGVPEDVRQLLETQLYQRSPAQRALLEAASVVHGEITTRTLAAALDRDAAAVESCCEGLARTALFLQVAGTVEWPDGAVARRYAFSHDFHRQVVYESIAEERRVRLHRRVGEALEDAWGTRAVDIASQLAMHFRRGGDGARAQRYVIAAGRRARARFATREAIACFASALAGIGALPEGADRDRAELEVRLELGGALADHEGFAAEPVRINYARVSELCATAGSEADLFEALYARWYLHALRGEAAETRALATQLKDVAQRLGTAGPLVLADSALVRLALWQGRLTETHGPMAALLAREAELRAAPVAPYGMDPVVAASMNYASALWILGETTGAQDAASAGIDRARASGNPFFLAGALAQGAMVRLFQRDTDIGTELAEQAASVAEEHEFSFWHAYASALLGWAMVQRGHVTEGALALERGASALQATGTHLFQTCVQAFLAEACLCTGAYADGLAAVAGGLDVAQRSFGCGYEPELWRLRGELLLASERGGSAGDVALQRAVELARATQARSLELKAALGLARTWRRRGRVAEARDVLAGVCAWFGDRRTSHDLVAARGLLAELSA